MAQDSKQLVQAVKDKHDGNRNIELVMTENGEMVAVPAAQADQMKGTKAGTIATQDYFQS
ncbi:MAG: hypothetical protein LBD55_09705 [Treponema sp.]|jgi:hypothetical protein|nr:hypothetical protein [Treponema sp.]